MAHLTLVTAGSRGDIQPYIALGLGLQARGHTARLATHALFADWIRGYGLEFAPVEGDPLAAFQQEQGRNWVETGRDGGDFLRLLDDPIDGARKLADRVYACLLYTSRCV